jgi:hypothetical protein
MRHLTASCVLLCVLLTGLAAPAQTADPMEKVRKELRELLAEDYAKKSPKDMQALARKLLALGRESKNDPNTATVMFTEARDLAASAGDPVTALEAVEEISRAFGVSNLAAKVEVLKTTSRVVRKPDACVVLAKAYLGVCEEAMEAEDYTTAERCALEAEKYARRGRDNSLTSDARARVEAARDIKREHARVKTSLERLKEDPEDPRANLDVGKFLCFFKGEWKEGLGKLALGSDEDLKGLAAADLASPKKANDQAELAGKWWDWAQKQFGRMRDRGRERAVMWYEQCLKKMSRLDRVVAEQRMQTYYDTLTGGAGGAIQQGNVAHSSRGATVEGANRGGEMIDGNTTEYTGSEGFASGSWPTVWIVRFPQAYLLREIRFLLWDGEDRFYRYALELSSDGKAFTPLVDRTKGKWRSWQVIQFPPRRVQAIKIKGTYNSANSGFYIVELEAYCRPPAKRPRPRYPSEP